MAKLVIAGKSDCPFFAKVELLADELASNLTDFNIHKIIKQPSDWQNWLSELNSKLGWSQKRSPVIWRELVNRGGKEMLIGGHNEFQEYAYRYYGARSDFMSEYLRNVAIENQQTKDELDEEERQRAAKSKPKKVCVSNASSPLCYSLLDSVCRGDALGPNTELHLKLLPSDPQEQTSGELEGLRMELRDLSAPLLRHVDVETDAQSAFTGADVIILLDELSRDKSESKRDWLRRNHELFTRYGRDIDAVCDHRVKVVVAGQGPLNFNAATLLKTAPTLRRQNVVTLSRMIERQAKAVIARQLSVNSAGIADVMVWGSPNARYYVDARQARVHRYDGAVYGPDWFSLPVAQMVHEVRWMEEVLPKQVAERLPSTCYERGADDEEERGDVGVPGDVGGRDGTRRYAVTLADSCVTLLNHWCNGASVNEIFSLGVYSEGWYDVPEGMMFSLPVIFHTPGYWKVVENIEIDDVLRAEIKASVQEQLEDWKLMNPSEITIQDETIKTEGEDEKMEADPVGEIPDPVEKLSEVSVPVSYEASSTSQDHSTQLDHADITSQPTTDNVNAEPSEQDSQGPAS